MSIKLDPSKGITLPGKTRTDITSVVGPDSGALFYDRTAGAPIIRRDNEWAHVGSVGFVFRRNPKSLDSDFTIGSTENASAAGPLTVTTGVTLTIDSGGELVIL